MRPRAGVRAWWLYFDHPGHLTPSPQQAFRWGYAHVVVFAALAALGAGLHLATEAVTGHGDARVGALAVAVPVAAYLLGTGAGDDDDRHPADQPADLPKLAGAVVVLIVGATASVAVTVAGCALVMMVLAASMALSTVEGREPATVRSQRGAQLRGRDHLDPG